MLRLALSDYIDRIVDGRGLRQRVITQPRSVGDIEVARQIREICNSVGDSAEAVSVLYYGPHTERQVREIDRYERAKKDSVLANVLAAVSDSFYPAFAAC